MKCYQIRNRIRSRSNSLRYTAEINLALFIIDHEARDVDGNLFKKNCEQETAPYFIIPYDITHGHRHRRKRPGQKTMPILMNVQKDDNVRTIPNKS